MSGFPNFGGAFFNPFFQNRRGCYQDTNQRQPRGNYFPSFFEGFSDFDSDPSFSGFSDNSFDPFYHIHPSAYQRQQQANQRQREAYYDPHYQKPSQKVHPKHSNKQEKQQRRPSPEYKDSYQKKADNKPTEEKFVSKHDDIKKKEPLLNLPIIFQIITHNDKKFYPIRKNISLATTIEEIAEIIAYECKIDDEIVVKYLSNRNLIRLDPNLTVADVLDKIKEIRNDGKVQYLIFIEIKSDKKDEITKPAKNTEKEERSKPTEKIENVSPNSENQTEAKSDLNPTENPKKPKKPKSISSFRPKIRQIPQESTTSTKTKPKPKPKAEEVESEEDDKPKVSEKVKREMPKQKTEEVEEDDKHKESEKVEKEIPKPSLNKYYFQINSEDEIREIELDDDATVKVLREEIKKMEGVRKLGNIKVLFSGKVLLNDIVLKSLNLGDSVLFVYIRTEEDILLLTAKALKVEADEEEEEEYEEESENEYEGE